MFWVTSISLQKAIPNSDCDDLREVYDLCKAIHKGACQKHCKYHKASSVHGTLVSVRKKTKTNLSP